jgi:hypothetical protein
LKVERCSLCAANAARLAFTCSSISLNVYWSSIHENKARASDSVIHPHSPTGKALSDADNASSSTALSLRASGGVDVPRPKAALIVFHIPMTEPLYCSTVNHHSLDPRGARWLTIRHETDDAARKARDLIAKALIRAISARVHGYCELNGHRPRLRPNCYLYPPFWGCFLTSAPLVRGFSSCGLPGPDGFSLLRRPLHRGRASKPATTPATAKAAANNF